MATITVNGILIWTNPAGAHTRDAAWQSVEYAIPMADNNPAVQIEWRLTSDNVINLGGWQLDDVEVGDTFVAPSPFRWRCSPSRPCRVDR